MTVNSRQQKRVKELTHSNSCVSNVYILFKIGLTVKLGKITSLKVETYGIDYGLPETLTPFDYMTWLYKQYGLDPNNLVTTE